jgi:hypothetical protein
LRLEPATRWTSPDPALNGITWEGFFQPGPEVYEGEYNSPVTPYCVRQPGICTYRGNLNGYSLSMALVSADGKTIAPMMDPSWDGAYAAGHLTPGTIGVHQGAIVEGGVPAFWSEVYTIFNNGSFDILGMPEYQQLFGSGAL